ncbi:MAG: SDR family oxidoreductase [Candidatus Helarchaeota archaeon]
MNLTGKKVLVTGAAGFIGSNIASTLLSYDCKVIGLDNFSTGRNENISSFQQHPNFTLLRADIRNLKFLTKNLKDIDIIFHEAALSSVTRSVENPLATNAVNITGTLNLLVIAKDLDVERFVFASSSSVYGETEILPKHEEMALYPFSPYGVSKLAAESYVSAFYKIYGLKTVSLRYFNVFGPNQTASPYSGVISIFISRVLKNKAPIIFGDGTQTRDFTYVKDVVQGNLLAATKKSAIGHVFNIATNQQISLLDLTKKILGLMGKTNLEIQYQPARLGDILHSLADITKAQKFLGYVPKYDIEKGIEETIHWFKHSGDA